MNIFDILGPIMIGPSSSHTAGAVRIGKIAGIVLGEAPKTANFYLHGSFSETYRGHGTDRALIGGLLGFSTEDERIRSSFQIAEEQGLKANFHKANLGDVHVNTVKVVVSGETGKEIQLTASSIGGGNIKVIDLLGFPVDFSGQFNTLIIPHYDRPGTIGAVTKLLGEEGINIAQMKVSRARMGSKAIMIIETDESSRLEVLEKIRALANILSAMTIEAF